MCSEFDSVDQPAFFAKSPFGTKEIERYHIHEDESGDYIYTKAY